MGSHRREATITHVVRGCRGRARSARRRIRGRCHAPSRTRAVWYYSFAHASSTGQFGAARIEQAATFTSGTQCAEPLPGCVGQWKILWRRRGACREAAFQMPQSQREALEQILSGSKTAKCVATAIGGADTKQGDLVDPYM